MEQSEDASNQVDYGARSIESASDAAQKVDNILFFHDFQGIKANHFCVK